MNKHQKKIERLNEEKLKSMSLAIEYYLNPHSFVPKQVLVGWKQEIDSLISKFEKQDNNLEEK